MGHGVPNFITSISKLATSTSDSNFNLLYLFNNVWQLKSLSALPLYLVYDNYVQLITVSIIGAFLLSFYLYVSSFKKNALLAKDGNTGYMIYDFFIGKISLMNIDYYDYC